MRLLLLSLLLPLPCGAQAGLPARIPQVHAVTLTGAPVDLPGGLPRRAAVLVFGFSQASRDQVAAWGRRLAQDYRDSSTVSYYELAELQSVPRPLRGWVSRKIAASVPDRARAHFVQLSDGEAEWKRLCALASSDHACVLLVDRDGMLLHRREGAVSDASYAELTQHLQPILGN